MLYYHTPYDPLVAISFRDPLIAFYHKFSVEICLILSFLDYNIALWIPFSVNET